MGFEPYETEQRSQLKDALAAANITVGELWLRYFSMSGTAGEYEVHAYLQGLISLPVTQRDLLAMACNEIISETPRLLAPYADQVNGTRPASGAGGSEDGRQWRDGTA